MTTGERAVLAAFVGTVLLVYAAAAVLACDWVLALVQGSRRAGVVFFWARALVFGLATLGILCLFWGRFVEPYRLAVTHVAVRTDRLRPGARPVRIVHISDTHCDPRPRLEERLPAVIVAVKPDLIVFTGDAVNSLDALPAFRRLMARLAAIAPTYAVRGNWDGFFPGETDFYGRTGVVELDGRAEAVQVGGATLWLMGVPPHDRSALPALCAQAPDGAYRIVLHHYPGIIYDAARERADLVLAGHTHGGQVALPFYGALITLAEHGKRFEAGLYEVGETRLYVSRGIGVSGIGFRVRFLCRPEVALIEVRPAAGR